MNQLCAVSVCEIRSAGDNKDRQGIDEKDVEEEMQDKERGGDKCGYECVLLCHEVTT